MRLNLCRPSPVAAHAQDHNLLLFLSCQQMTLTPHLASVIWLARARETKWREPAKRNALEFLNEFRRELERSLLERDIAWAI